MSVYHFSRLFLQSRYINRSVQKVEEHFSLYRTYNQFRTLGLRHLLVVDIKNQLKGIITRQDLMQYKMQERISQAYESGRYLTDGDSICTRSSMQPVKNPSVSNGHLNQGFEVDEVKTQLWW